MATDYRMLLKKYMKRIFELTGTDFPLYCPDDEFSMEEVQILRELSDEAYLEVR